MGTILEFHERLTAERKRLRMTQREFAEACGVKPPTQFLYEKGDRSPNATYLSKALVCGVNLAALFYGDEEPSMGSALPSAEIMKLYTTCDQLCRDPEGRLLDLEERASVFKGLYSEQIARLNKMAS